MNGIDIARRVYTRLRKPSQQALPWKTVMQTVGEVIARKKLDLALSQQNSLATTSAWFTPASVDFDLEELGLEGGVLLPIRVETRGVGSELESGDDVPIVNYEVLNTSNVGAISFYGDPLRIAFRDGLDYISEQEYRLVYESDFSDEVGLDMVVGLPAFFASMVVLEAAYELLEVVEDTSPEWEAFFEMADKRWPVQIADKREGWDKYVRMFKGRAQVPKRTFFDNRRSRIEPRQFRG